MKTNSLPPLDWRRIPHKLRPVASLYCGPTTYNQAARMLQDGEISDKEFARYRFFWTWETVRLSDQEDACNRQHLCRLALGADGLARRFERVRRWHRNMVAKLFAEYIATDSLREVPLCTAAHTDWSSNERKSEGISHASAMAQAAGRGLEHAYPFGYISGDSGP